MAVQRGPDDAPDGDDEQSSQGHVGAGEDGGGGGDGEGGCGCLGQRGEEGDEGAGEGREDEGGQAERPDAGVGLRVGQASPPACAADVGVV